MVDGYDNSGTSISGIFSLTTDVSSTPIGDVCENAEVLTLPASRAADSLANYADNYRASLGCASGTTNAERVYRVTVPANNRLTAVATASTNADGGVAFNPAVNIVPASTTCILALTCAGGASGVSGVASANWDNVGNAATDVFVIVDSTVAPAGTYSLTIAASAQTFPAGDVCTNVGAPITATTTFQGDTFAGFGDQYQPRGQNSCSYLPGLDRVYAVTIPAGQIMTATAYASDAGALPDGGTINLALSVVPAATDCQLGPCVTSSDNTSAAGSSEVVIRSNSTGANPESVLLVVDSNLPAAAGSFALNVNLVAPPVGDTCSDTQTAITASVSRGMEDLAGYANDYSTVVSGCAFRGGGERTYRITIPAGFALTATTTTTADHSLSLVNGPAANCAAPTTCLASADVVLTGGGETITFNHWAPKPLRVFLVVGRFGSMGTTPYALAIDLSAIPAPAYTKTTTASSCSTFTAAATTVTAAIADDASSTWAALPFTFSYFGAPVTSYSVSSNGLVGLSSLTTGSIAIFAFNPSIPTASTPNGMIAPMWDDLLNTTGSTVQVEAFGTAPNRQFVVGWTNVAFFDDITELATAHRITFQAKLFEGTNVIEFHYCSLAANGATTNRETGATATVGVENEAGTLGVQHSFNTASSVNTTDALRFTP